MLQAISAQTFADKPFLTAIIIMHTLCLLLVTLAPVVLGDDLLTVATNNGCGKLVNAIQSAGFADTLRAASE